MAIERNPLTRRQFLAFSLAAGAVLAACGTATAPARSPASQAPSSASAGGPTASPAAVASGSAAPAPLTKLRVAYGSTTLLNLPIWAAYEQGFFKKYGLDVELTQIRGATITQALIGHSVDVIGSTGSSTSLANLEGGDTLLVGSNMNAVHNDIVVNPKTVQKPEDLRGKTAAVTKRGDFSETAIVIGLASIGMDRDAVKYLTGFPGDEERVSALVRGAADVTSLDVGLRKQYTEAGLKRLFSLLDVKNHYIMSGIYTSRAYANDHATAIESYIKAMTESLYFFHHDQAGTLKVASKYMKEPPDEIEPGYELFKPRVNKVPEFTLEDVKETLSALVSTNPKMKTAKPEDFYTTQYLDAVRQSGFFDQIWGADLQAK